MIFHIFDQLTEMSDVNWSKLNHLEPNLAWSVLASEISDTFFNGTLLVVPTIEEAFYFDLMVCFSKVNDNILNKMSKSKCRLHGHFLDLASEGKTDKKLLKVLRNPLKEDINSDYSSYWSDGNSRAVTITLQGMKKYVMNWNLDGDLVLDHKKFDLRNRSVYVISEVVYAEKIIVEVQIYYTKNVYHFEQERPVAFSYLKFPVDKNGTLQAAKDTKLNFDAVFEPVEDYE